MSVLVVFCCGCSCVIGSVSFPDNCVRVQGLEKEGHCVYDCKIHKHQFKNNNVLHSYRPFLGAATMKQ